MKVPAQAPSSPGYGLAIVLMIVSAAVVVLTYTLAPLPGQNALGAWNYLLAIGLVLGAMELARRFRPVPYVREDLVLRPRLKHRTPSTEED